MNISMHEARNIYTFNTFRICAMVIVCRRPANAARKGRKEEGSKWGNIKIEISLSQVEWSSLANIMGSNDGKLMNWLYGKGIQRERCTLLAGTGATAVSASATNARRTRRH